MHSSHFLNYCFCTSSPGWVSLHIEPFKRSISVPYSPLGPPDMSPTGFLRKMLWRFVVAGPKGWGPWCGAWIPHSSGRSCRFVSSLLIVHCCSGSGVLVRLSLTFRPVLTWAFCFLWRSCSAGFQVFFRWIANVAIDSVCPWEEVIQDLPTLPSWVSSLHLFLSWEFLTQTDMLATRKLIYTLL